MKIETYMRLRSEWEKKRKYFKSKSKRKKNEWMEEKENKRVDGQTRNRKAGNKRKRNTKGKRKERREKRKWKKRGKKFKIKISRKQKIKNMIEQKREERREKRNRNFLVCIEDMYLDNFLYSRLFITTSDCILWINIAFWGPVKLFHNLFPFRVAGRVFRYKIKHETEFSSSWVTTRDYMVRTHMCTSAEHVCSYSLLFKLCVHDTLKRDC